MYKCPSSEDLETDMIAIEYYKLGTKVCRHHCKNGGVCIFLHEFIDFNTIPTHNICKDGYGVMTV